MKAALLTVLTVLTFSILSTTAHSETCLASCLNNNGFSIRMVSIVSKGDDLENALQGLLVEAEKKCGKGAVIATSVDNSKKSINFDVRKACL